MTIDPDTAAMALRYWLDQWETLAPHRRAHLWEQAGDMFRAFQVRAYTGNTGPATAEEYALADNPDTSPRFAAFLNLVLPKLPTGAAVAHGPATVLVEGAVPGLPFVVTKDADGRWRFDMEPQP